MRELEHEAEARVNALRQLLRATEAEMIRALEGRMSWAEYEEMRLQRQAWQNELATLEGRPEDVQEDEPGIMEISTATVIATVDLEYRMILLEMGV